MLASMAPGLPFAIAAQPAHPGRQVVMIVGDGGFGMLTAEMSTAVRYGLPIKVFVLRNDALAEVMFEQKQLGNPVYGCELGAIDYTQVSAACGADARRFENFGDLRGAVGATLRSGRTSLLEVRVDPNEVVTKPDELRG
jgi:pyruvate dehydrogenase (quinone)/pyruvate decarboxylase